MIIDVVADVNELCVRIREGHIVFPLHEASDERPSRFYPVFKDFQGWYMFKPRKYLKVNKEEFITSDGLTAYKYDLKINDNRRYGNKTIVCTDGYTLYYDFNLNIVYKVKYEELYFIRQAFIEFKFCVPNQVLGTIYETAHELICFVGNRNTTDFDYFKIRSAIEQDKNIGY